MDQPEFKDVATFVTGAVVEYWRETQQGPPCGENFESYLSDSISKVWAHVSENRSTGDFSDLQCVIGTRLRSIYKLYR